jgi:hypothetical protein
MAPMRTKIAATVLSAGLSVAAAASSAEGQQTRIVPGPDGRPIVARVATSVGRGPETFGTNTEFSHIAGAFHALDTDPHVNQFDFFYMRPLVDGTWLFADLALEDGVYLQSLTMFFKDALSTADLTLSLCLGASHPDGSTPGFDCFWAVTTNGTPGFSSIEMPVNATVRYSFDVDNDGVRDDVRWMVFVYFPVNDPELELGGVRAAWNRQVSPAPGVATFTDVPTSHPQFQFIEALVAAGITAGCGGGNYCPTNPLTRGQMAVFLAKALGLHWSASSP